MHFDSGSPIYHDRRPNNLAKVIAYVLDQQKQDDPVKARRREEITNKLFLPFCRMHRIESALSPTQCIAYGQKLPVSLEAEIDKHTEFRRYVSRMEFGGVFQTPQKELHVLLFELLSEAGDHRFGLSTSQSLSRSVHSRNRAKKTFPANHEVEELNAPACEIINIDPATSSIKAMKILMTHDAYAEARLRLQKVKTEVDIWGISSPFASATLFTEQSALIRLAINAVNKGIKEYQKLLLEPYDSPPFVLGFQRLAHDDYAHTVCLDSVVTSLVGDSGKAMESPLSLWKRRSIIKFELLPTHEVVAKEFEHKETSISRQERATIVDQLRESDHLQFLRNPKLFQWLQTRPKWLYDAGFSSTPPDVGEN